MVEEREIGCRHEHDREVDQPAVPRHQRPDDGHGVEARQADLAQAAQVGVLKGATELTAEFARFVLDHPEVDESLPEDSYVYFEVSGDSAFNHYSRELALRRQGEDGMTIVCVRVRGLAPPQGSRLIDPEIVPAASAA